MRLRPRFARRGLHGRSDRPHLLAVVENVPFCVDTRLRKQVESLLEHGYRVSVVTRRDEGNQVFSDIPDLRLLQYSCPYEAVSALGYLIEYGVSLLFAVLTCLRVCLSERVDVVQFCQPPDVYFPLAWLLRVLGCTILVDQRDLMSELYISRFRRTHPFVLRLLERFARWDYRVAHHVLCVNGYLERHALVSGVSPSGVTIVRNGPVLSRIDRAVATPALKRATYLCCWVGKMGRQDRLDLLLSVTERLAHGLGRTDWHLAILGDGECLEETKAAAARLRLEPWVTFTGWVPEDVVFQYLATADLGLDASLQAEVSPVKAMEYMGAGLPFAAFDLAETRAVAGDAAALAPPGDVDALSTMVSSLLDDTGLRRQLGRRGRERVASELAWEHQAVAYLDVVDRLVRGTSRDSHPSRRISA